MSLIITFMLEPAKLQMNWAKASGTSALRSAFDRSRAACCATLHLPRIHAVTNSSPPPGSVPERQPSERHPQRAIA
jgi:hypothetical protein